MRDDLLAAGCKASRVIAMPMGVCADFDGIALAEARSSAVLNVVCAGSVSAERGRDVMPEGLAMTRQSEARVCLTIIGAAAEQAAYRMQCAQALGIAETLEAHGRLPGRAMPQMLAKAHLDICHWEQRAWWEFNPPTKLLEYLAAGLPVVASRIRTHSAHLRDCKTGVLFDYGADTLAKSLCRVDPQSQRLPAMARAAHKDGQRYRWPTVEGEFMGAIEATLTDPAPQPSAVPAEPEWHA